MINAMRAHSSPMRAYLLDAMVYDVMYARFPIARAKWTLSSSLAGVEKGSASCKECEDGLFVTAWVVWSQGSRDMGQ
jgi:hypothetical protein